MGRLVWFALAYVAYPLLTASSAAVLAARRFAGWTLAAGAALTLALLLVAAFLGARARQARAHPLSALIPAALAVGLSLWPRLGVTVAQEIGAAPSFFPGTERVALYSRAEKIGFLLLGGSAAFFAGAWHLAGKQRRLRQW